MTRCAMRHPAEIFGWTLSEIALGLQAVEDDEKGGETSQTSEEIAATARRAALMTPAERLRVSKAWRDR